MTENKSGRDYILGKFKKDVLKTEKEDKHKLLSRDYVLVVTAGLIILINVLLLIYDTLFGGFGISHGIGLIGLIVNTISSILLLVLPLINKKVKAEVLRTISMLYKLGVLVSVATLNINHNMELTAFTDVSEHMTVSFAPFYLIIIALMPSPYLIDGVILCLLGAGSVVVPLFLKGHEYYNLIFNIIIFIVVGLLYTFFYLSNKLHDENQKKLIEINDSLLNASYLDALTNTFNRRAYYEYIHHISSDESIINVGSIIFDIDDFKAFNDLYSHTKGDNCLQVVSKSVMDVLDEKGIYLFRYGGEEFVAFVINPKEEELIEIGKKIVKAVSDADLKRYDTERKCVTITCGLAILKVLHGVNADYVLKADESLYYGKNHGKNCVVYDSEIR